MQLRGTTRFPKRARNTVQRLTSDLTTVVQSAKPKSATVAKRRAIKQSAIVGKKLTFAGKYFKSSTKEFVGTVTRQQKDGQYEVRFYDGKWILPKKDIETLAAKQLKIGAKPAGPKKRRRSATTAAPVKKRQRQELNGYQKLVMDAVTSASTRKGCSNVAIGKAIQSVKKEASNTFVKKAIRALVTKGFLQPKQPNARTYVAVKKTITKVKPKKIKPKKTKPKKTKPKKTKSKKIKSKKIKSKKIKPKINSRAKAILEELRAREEKKKNKKLKKLKENKAESKEATVPTPAQTAIPSAAPPPAQPVLARSLSISYGVDVLKSCDLAGVSRVVCDESDIPYDCELTQIRPELNMDKYYNFQLIKTADGEYKLHTEWGRTGQAPQHQTTGPFTKAVGIAAFAKQFQKKTGNNWDDRATAKEQPNKYKYVHRTTAVRTAYKWQYYMDSGNMHGESSGWYDYSADASVTVNLICAQWTDNKDIPLRVVKSNYFEYFVDFDKMVQRNTSTRKERPIRRVNVDTGAIVDPHLHAFGGN